MAKHLRRGILAAAVGLVVAGAIGYPGYPAAAQAEDRVIRAAKHPVAGHYVVFLKEGAQTLSGRAITDASKAHEAVRRQAALGVGHRRTRLLRHEPQQP